MTTRKTKKVYDYFVLIHSPKHPRAYSSGYVPEQILVAEKALGRNLTQDEEVRHINGDTRDNKPSNLEITSSYADYRVQSIEASLGITRKNSSKTFISCKFQRPCWKEIRSPIIKRDKVYLPYVCSYQTEGDIYKCSHFWDYLDKHQQEQESRDSIAD